MFNGNRRIALIAIAVLTVVSAVNAGGIRDKPFQAHAHLTSVLSFGSPRCDPGHGLSTIEGGGSASYMGVVTDQQSHCIDLATGRVYDGEYTLTADDGTIYGTYEAQSIPTVNCPDIAAGQCVFSIRGQYTIDGGTGRFSAVLTGGGGPARGLFDGTTGEVGLFLGGNILSDGAIKGEY